MKKREAATFLFALIFLIHLGCDSNRTEPGKKTKEDSAMTGKEGAENPKEIMDMTKEEFLTFVGEIEEKQKLGDLRKTETPSVPVKMEIKLFEKTEFTNDQYYFEAGLTSPKIVETIISKTDKFVFSPQKLFDSDSQTCMAVTHDYLNRQNQRFLSLSSNYLFYLNRFYVTPQITGFVIEGGYFDEAYYRKNARVKEIRMIIESDAGNSSEKIIIDETFALNDTMEPQIFVFKNHPGRRIEAVDIYVTDTYQGEEWQDICISGLRFLSNNYIIPVKLNPKCYNYIDWYCDNKLPVIGQWRIDMGAENNTGVIQITYDNDGRIKRLKIYNTYSEYVERPPEIICSYIYSNNKITVYDETNNRQICEYVFQDGKLIYEKRNKFSVSNFSGYGYDNAVENEFVYTNGKDSSDNVREFVVRDDQYGHEILRIEYELSASEHDFYDTNGVIVRSRRESEWLLPPVQFLKLAAIGR
jgi:hypothetical protein